MSAPRWLTIAALIVSPAFGQLTIDQKTSDFTQLAALYSRHYAPYELKLALYGFDLYNIRPWLQQVQASKTDIEFYDVCVRYVASLKDSHDEFTINALFEAYLPLGVDIYDGKVLIDYIDRGMLPSRLFPFTIGDELVSLDGKPMAQWITELQPYAVNGASNPVSRNRLAASIAIDRYQGWWPGAALSLGDRTTATIEVRRAGIGTDTYIVPWQIYGVPVLGEGPLPPFLMQRATREPASTGPTMAQRLKGDAEVNPDSNPWGVWTGEPAEIAPDVVPDYMEGIRKLTYSVPLQSFLKLGSILPFSSLTPVFDPPAGFRIRLGGSAGDQFLSGTYVAGANTIGFIRIPAMSPPSTTLALQQFAREIAYFQLNTNGLVIDVMANGGGDGCYTQNLVRYLIPQTFRGLTQSLRATQSWVGVFTRSLANAKASGAPQYVIDLYTVYLQQVQQAMAENRGMTGPLPMCGPYIETSTAVDSSGRSVAYTKPILVLTDNFTLSAGEVFTMMLQDEKRATVFGMTTDGGGGNVVGYTTTAFSEGFTRVTEGLIVRANPVAVPGFPAMLFYDGVGIAPDMQQDYMTVDNLMTGGESFVEAVTTAINGLIAAGTATPTSDSGGARGSRDREVTQRH